MCSSTCIVVRNGSRSPRLCCNCATTANYTTRMGCVVRLVQPTLTHPVVQCATIPNDGSLQSIFDSTQSHVSSNLSLLLGCWHSYHRQYYLLHHLRHQSTAYRKLYDGRHLVSLGHIDVGLWSIRYAKAWTGEQDDDAFVATSNRKSSSNMIQYPIHRAFLCVSTLLSSSSPATLPWPLVGQVGPNARIHARVLYPWWAVGAGCLQSPVT
mmetsp:Transcript_15838/g.23351  ORF Transcript_15838/g.23351 Transcript_15838/m.23351 type:complete len:210 (+) Transcript_15838:1268-1897(+)